MGYLRAKIHSRNILVNCLIDSGNLFADLISEELAKVLNLRIHGPTRKVGTASAKGTVEILGKTETIRLYLEGVREAVSFTPYVVKDLSHHINLGQAFLRKNHADMTFREYGTTLSLKGSVTSLAPACAPVTRPTIDGRIGKMLQLYKDRGENPTLRSPDLLDLRVHQVGEASDVQEETVRVKPPLRPTGEGIFHVNVARSVTIKANTTQPVLISEKVPRSASVVVTPKPDNSYLNDKSLFVSPGCYGENEDQLLVFVSNLSSKDAVLPAQCHLGYGMYVTDSPAGPPPQAPSQREAGDHDLGPGQALHALDHRDPGKLTEAELLERRQFIIETLQLDQNDLLKGRNDLKDQVVEIFMKNFDACCISDDDFGRTELTQFDIRLQEGAQPVQAKLRPLNPIQEADLQRQMDAWLDSQLIEPSQSPWASALVPVSKKGSDKLRWTVDYRALNKVTVKDAFPLGNIETNLHRLQGSKVYSALDSSNAFHAIPIPEECRDFTSFITPMGSFRFTRMPFGVCNAPSQYSRLVQLAMEKLPGGHNYALAYLDDIVTHSKTLEDHVQHLESVVSMHAASGMKLNLRKCKLFQAEVEYLGHLVSTEGIRMIPRYVDRVIDWPLPETGKQLRSFLGFCGYYRTFIKDFSFLTHEMNKLKMSKTLEWTPEIKEKFHKLKEAFKAQPVRGYPDYYSPEPFVLDTDFSATNLAAVLSQKQGGQEVFLGCHARKCNQAESNYPSYKGECAAVIYGLQKFEHVLRARPFIIRTDSTAVTYLNTVKESRGIFARWFTYLASFDYKLIHRAGKKQTNADGLSRMPGLEVETEREDFEDDFGDIDDIYAIPALQEPLTPGRIAEATSRDPVLRRVRELVERGTKPNREERKPLTATGVEYAQVYEMLSCENGVVYYTPPELNGKKHVRRACLPTELYPVAFKAVHNDTLTGHFGVAKTFDKLRNRFYFPYLYHYVAAMVNNCPSCLAKRTSTGRVPRNQHREKLSYFGQRVYIDTVGRLTPHLYHGRSCQHILTIQDGYTRWLEAIPIENVESQTVLEALFDNWVCRFGVMETLHSDNGTAFTARVFADLMAKLGVVHTFTPPYSPDANRVERAHKVLGALLRADRRHEARNWPAKLAVAVFAYNSSPNRVTGVSPYKLLHGRDPILPLDFIFPREDEKGSPLAEYVQTLNMRFARIFAQVAETQEGYLLTEFARDQKRAPAPLQVNDTCYYFTERLPRGLSRKLANRWLGPFVVQRKLSDSLYQIYPVGAWCENPKSVISLVRKLRKVDPDLLRRSETHRTTRYQVDLSNLVDDLEDAPGLIRYQADFEENRPPPEVGAPVPPWRAKHALTARGPPVVDLESEDEEDEAVVEAEAVPEGTPDTPPTAERAPGPNFKEDPEVGAGPVTPEAPPVLGPPPPAPDLEPEQPPRRAAADSARERLSEQLRPRRGWGVRAYNRLLDPSEVRERGLGPRGRPRGATMQRRGRL